MFVDTRTYSSVDSMIKRESDKSLWVLDWVMLSHVIYIMMHYTVLVVGIINI